MRGVCSWKGRNFMFVGTVFVLTSCMIWGLIFVIPQLMAGFSPIEVALGRYFFFGAISLLIFLKGGLKWFQLSKVIWVKAFIYSLVVTFLYYIFLVLGLRYSSAAVMTLIAGISPLSLTFFGNKKNHIFSFKQLILPSAFLLTGLLLVNIPAFQIESHHSTLLEYLFGLICGLMALITWNWYVIANDQFLKDYPQVSSSDWATLVGVATLGWSIFIGGILFFFIEDSSSINKFLVWNPELKNFLLGSLILGLFSSWLGSYLWNQGSRRIPVALAGQLTIFETIFGLLYVYTYAQRFPQPLEFLGIILMLSGVLITLHVFQRNRKILSV